MNWKKYLALLISLFMSNSVIAISIKNVSHSRASFDPAKENVSISFKLDEPARIKVSIYDARDILVRRLTKETFVNAGQHTVVWDGRDQLNRVVPTEAYHYTILAKNKSGQMVEHDLTEMTRGKAKAIESLKWDSSKGIINFNLRHPSRVRLRVGLKNNGPMLNTLLNWDARVAGVQNIAWNGMDKNSLIELGRHKNLSVSGRAYKFSDNTIIVNSSNKNRFISDVTWGTEKRIFKNKQKRKMFDQHLLSITAIGDFGLEFYILNKTKDSKAIPVSGKVALRLDVSSLSKKRITEQRFELVFYLDGKFLGESESGVLPTTWNWDPKGINPGVHYLTANVRGYDGDFGAATLKIIYQP